MRKTKLLATVVTTVATVVCGSFGAQAAWPDRPVTIIVPAGAGGGTDATGRLLAAQLKDIFGQNFNVVNQGQGGGVIGITSIVQAAPDGYTIGVLYNYAHYKELGQADFEVSSFTPIAQYNFDPAGFQVKADSPFKNITQALDAIKADPAKYNIACGGGCGGSWPLAVATLMYDWGVDLGKVNMIPGKGAAAAIQELAAGGVDVVPCSIPEAGPLIQAGKVLSLAVFGDKRLDAFPDIPTLQEETGKALSLGAWRGVVGPAGLPQDIADKLGAAVKKIYDSKQFQDAMTSRGFGLKWRDSKDFKAFMVNETTNVKVVIKALGL
ncbi:Bug family tripartite tricarboxylate transporter substrate binding protein [Shumkonia mesophila]|uniref:Bug family tripartite tricarboxylate transporter substrate binding protein n=1 Tax=Shumkonia mesophila TaxID=2838854 RepID=UPI0029345961|nr:tripartite tricarboxylate transporter substrate binding protein [Shumkonia mesophila]